MKPVVSSLWICVVAIPFAVNASESLASANDTGTGIVRASVQAEARDGLATNSGSERYRLLRSETRQTLGITAIREGQKKKAQGSIRENPRFLANRP